MGIEAIVSRLCTEIAVYWGSPVSDGMGSFAFATPIEIPCRWQESGQILSDKDGNEIISKAVVYVTQDLDEEGMLYLGTLIDLGITSDNISVDDTNVDVDDTDVTVDDAGTALAVSDPKSVDKAYFINRFEKSPVLRGSGFLRKVYLTPK